MGEIRKNYIGIADFIYTPFHKEKEEKESNEGNKSEVLRLSSIIILMLLFL